MVIIFWFWKSEIFRRKFSESSRPMWGQFQANFWKNFRKVKFRTSKFRGSPPKSEFRDHATTLSIKNRWKRAIFDALSSCVVIWRPKFGPGPGLEKWCQSGKRFSTFSDLFFLLKRGSAGQDPCVTSTIFLIRILIRDFKGLRQQILGRARILRKR